MTAIPYAEPLDVASPADCAWYHTMELPGFGLIEGAWDFRGQEEFFFSDTKPAGKRVLEVGPATGWLGFRLEALGAEVTSVELPSGQHWDVVPLAAADPARIVVSREREIHRVRRSYWLSHKALGSKNRVVSCSGYDTPEAAGPFDIALFANVLTHMRDPFRALEHNLAFTRERAIVVEQLPPGWTPQTPGATLLFQPDHRNPEFYDTWWSLSPTVLVKMLGVLGFERCTVVLHEQLCNKSTPVSLATVVGTRTRPPFRLPGGMG